MGDSTDHDDPQSVLLVLENQAKLIGGSIEVIPFKRFVEGIDSQVKSPVVMVHESGHLHILLGRLEFDNETYYQIVHGSEGPFAVSADQFMHGGFREAWIFHGKGEQAAIPLNVGSGCITVDKIWHNFGEIHPFNTSKGVFTFKNIGETSIVLGKPLTSCGCTVAKLADDERNLAPGKSAKMEVLLSTGKSSDIRYSIMLKLFQQGTDNSRWLKLEVLGNQRESMDVAPTSLDFGTVEPGHLVSRTLQLSEVPTDRFILKQVDAGKLPLRHTITNSQAKDGLITYRVHLELNPADLKPGEHQGELRVATDSALRPIVIIPVKYQAKSPVQITPSIAAFGTVAMGDKPEQRIRLTSTRGQPIKVSILSAPPDCSVSVEQSDTLAELIIKPDFSQAGIWNRRIQIQVESADFHETQELECVGYVTSLK